MGLLELLESGDVESFNLQRGERSRPDLFAADLPEKSLAGVDLSRANVDKADLTGSDLSDATLYRTSFTGIDGTGLKLCRAIGVKVRFKEAWLDEADFTEADLSRADFSEANLEKSVGENLRLTGARLRGVQGAGLRWPGADLTESNLHKADLTGAELRHATLIDASGAEAVLDDAKLDHAIADGLKLPSASMKQSSWVGARLVGANLAGADLSGADFSNADLSRANLTGAVLAGARLQGAVLVDASLDGADLTGAALLGADLSGVDPGSVSLTEAQRQEVAAIGVQVDPDAPLRFESIASARNGDRVAVLWENPEDDEPSSLRFAVLGGPEPAHGVVPVPLAGVRARGIAARGEGFALVVIRERTGGVVGQVLELGKDGTLGRSYSAPLGYEPSGQPVISSEGGELRMWGLARRGPTLVVHALGEEGLIPVHSEPQATAQNFLGRHAPALGCKGGVILPVGPRGAQRPLRAPEGFPGAMGLAVPVQNDEGSQVVAIWLELRVGTRRGGLRHAWLGSRGAPEVEALSGVSGVVALDAVATPDGVEVAWVEAGETGLGASTVYRVRLPGGEPRVVAAEIADVQEVTFAPGPEAPWLALTTLDEELVLLDEAGLEVGRLKSG